MTDAAGEQIAETDGSNEVDNTSFFPDGKVPDGLREQLGLDAEAESPPADEGNVVETEPAETPDDAEAAADDSETELSAEDKAKEAAKRLAFENRELKRQLAAKDAPEPELQGRDDFESDEQYRDYLLEEGRRQATTTERDAAVSDFDRRVIEFEVENPGFEDALRDPNLPMSETMGGFITESDVGLLVAKELIDNPAEVARISELSPTQQAREMLKLEGKITRQQAKLKNAKAETSRAPRSPDPVNGSDPGLPTSASDPTTSDKMSTDEWLKSRNKEIAARNK